MLHLFGADYSVYVRAVRIALCEKGLTHEQTAIDIFDEAGPPDDYLELHPLGKIPALRDGDFELFETTAILQYLDEAFEGPALQPIEPKARARMAQVMSILNSYAYKTLVWDIYAERVVRPQEGLKTDETKVADALPAARQILSALDRLSQVNAPVLPSQPPNLASCLAAPMFDLFLKAPEAGPLMKNVPQLHASLNALFKRQSFITTKPTVSSN